MKNFAYLLTFPLLLFACSSEIEEADISQRDKTNIEISIPMPDDMKTRGFSDGSSINNLKCYVYGRNKGTDTDPLFIEDIVLKNYPDHLGSHYSLYLPDGQAYDLVFFATCGAHDDPDGKLFYDRKARTVTVDYNSAVTNDESIDCFFGSIQEVSPAKGISYSVTLKRPYAQLNIGTKDISDYNAMSYSPLKAVAVTVDGIYSSFSAMDGSLTGDVSKLSFPQSERPSGQTFPVAGYDYLSMNYLLVNQQKKVDVTMMVWNQSSSFDCSFSQIPLQRNCRTNIYGNLLTKSNDYKVEINNLYDGVDDKEVDKYFGYDLVAKVGEAGSGTKPTKPGNPDEEDEDSDTRPVKPGTGDENTESEDKKPRLSLYYQLSESGPVESIDLSNYIDNTNTLKVSWEELGLSNVYRISFDGFPISRSGLTELMKFDYQKLNIKSFNSLFGNCFSLTKIHGIDKWDTSMITDMSEMFLSCSNLTSIDVSNFDTSNVTDMSHMFHGCHNLTSLDVTNFNTSKVKNMSSMFNDCDDLTSIDVSSFDTSNVTDMNQMFRYCSQLSSLELTNFNTSKVKNMSGMFSECRSLTSLNVTSFNTNQVTDFSFFMSGCRNLQFVDLSHLDTRNCTTMYCMFQSCENMTAFDLSNFNTSNCVNFETMFSNCANITTLDIRNFDFSNSEHIWDMFNSCEKLTTLYWNVNLTKTQTTGEMKTYLFKGTSALTNIYGTFSNFTVVNWDNNDSLVEVFIRDAPLSNESFRMIINGLGNNQRKQYLIVTRQQWDACLADGTVSYLDRNKNWWLQTYSN